MRHPAALVAALVLFGSGGLVAAADSLLSDSPVLSFWADPATSVAITWFRAREIHEVEIRDPAGRTTAFPVLQDGPVRRALISGLQPSTTYEYRAATAESTARWRSFTTAPGSDTDGPGSFAFAVAGDLQPFNEETRRTTSLGMTKLSGLGAAFILQLGDVAEYGFSRQSWSQAIRSLSHAADETPVVATAGNHDYYGLRPAPYFKSVFPAPYASPDTTGNTWYSLDIGPVHVAVLDTEAKGRNQAKQLEWLEADLAAARRSGRKWLFVSMHRPAIASSLGPADPRRAAQFLPVFARHGVTAVFWGHDHLYEHYEFRYGSNGYVFEPGHRPAAQSTHFFTTGTIGARVDALYPGFFTRRPTTFRLDLFDVDSGAPAPLEFRQVRWNPERVLREAPGVRFQDPDVYVQAASYYSYPFDSLEDFRERRYSDDPSVRYSSDAQFFGHTYGETSIHYLWVEIRGDECTITAHYIDGPDGEHGAVITNPDGLPERWVIESE